MARFSLKGIASQWFRDYIRPFLDGLSWRQFRDRFEEYFIPFSVRQEYRERFERLVKGESSVAEYTRQFVQLSRYAPYAVGIEEQKNSKYISGLGPEFVSLVQSRRSSFLEVTDMARQMEMTLRGFSQGTDDCRKKKTRVEGQSSAQPVVPYYGSGSYSGGTNQQTRQRSHHVQRKGRHNRRSNRVFRHGQGLMVVGKTSSGPTLVGCVAGHIRNRA
ncbi:uncharacterized protein LOC125369959 [Ricinus communis]|uniref:uncharacterized protein LOC125369959 n=1 Tax=Ricinus communis TaxID=3988 RepID=UPI00201AAAEF|nr:uncharacterized protein LOC125369959 [Ricinus communis]